MLYRGMDRAQLDAAYNNSAAFPERDAIVADWATRSAKVRREYGGRLDLAYGNTPRERLDLFLAADSHAATLAFIHGGYWQMNDKENFAFFAEGLLPLGINLAVIEYTLAPAARLDRIVAEARRSVRWLAEHLAECDADPNRLYVAGHSAGGHLTAMTMPLAEVRGGIAISGIYDLEPIRLNYLNEKLGLDTAEGRTQQPGPAFAGNGRRAGGGLRHPGIARIVPPVDRIWPGADRAGASGAPAAGRLRRPFHDSGGAGPTGGRPDASASGNARSLVAGAEPLDFLAPHLQREPLFLGRGQLLTRGGDELAALNRARSRA
jgi:arylformamidase